MANRYRKLHTAVALMTAALCFAGLPQAILTGFVLIVLWTFFTDRKVFRKVGKPRFWIFSVSITLLAGLLLGRDPESVMGFGLSRAGLTAGVLMSVRGFSLVLAAVLLSRGVTWDRFAVLAGRVGLDNLNGAYSTALETLPRMQRAWKDTWREGQGKKSLLENIAAQFIIAAELAKGNPLTALRTYAVTGRHGAGKTTLLREIAKQAELRGCSTGGFFQEPILDPNGKITGFNVVRVGSGETELLAEGNVGSGFSFSRDAFETAANWLREDSETAGLLVVDELGLLEARGKGHLVPIFELAAAGRKPLLLVSLRKDRLKEFIELFGLQSDHILDLDHAKSDTANFADRILHAAAV